ncbi:MAG: GntR family transcriptional regulator [Hyphomicrobiaceae bacterium]|nr:MAG: GntR family transcriptional regulator [Hyphomicrobiaceae bacterium]
MPMLTSSDTFKPRTKEDYAYDVLRSAILSCELKPGDRLVLDALSHQLGISSIPMRAALQRLQSEGLVEITPHTGAVVSDLSPINIEEVSLVLERLELLGFELAMQAATNEDISALRAHIEKMDVILARGDADRWSDLNRELHHSVAALSKNKLLMEFTARALDSWIRLRRWYLPEVVLQLAQAQDEHRQMVELLARRDLHAMGVLLYEHHERIRKMHRRAIVQPAPPDSVR